MKRWLLATTMLSTLSCAPAPRVDDRAICDGTRGLRQDHAAGLLVDGGPASRRTGAALIVNLDAACLDVDLDGPGRYLR